VKNTKLHNQVSTCIKQKCQQDIRICVAALDHTGIILISFIHCILGYTFSSWVLLQFSTCLVGELGASCTIAPNDREARSKHNSVANWGTRHSCQFTHSTDLSDIRCCPLKGLYLHTEQHEQNKCTQTSMPGVGFETTIPVFERVKSVHVLHSAVTVNC
jgi:hypothetical protein